MTTTPRGLRQIPITVSAALDPMLEEHRSSLQKFRQHFRQHFKIDPKAGEVSLGRYGKIFLESTAVLPCVQTALRWSRQEAEQLCTAYYDAGLGGLMASPGYKRIINLTAGAVQQAVKYAPHHVNFPALVREAVATYIKSEPAVLEAVNEMERISETVDRNVGQLRRYPGSVVRMENGEALITVERDGREELRSVAAVLLQSVGISDHGDAFFLNELHWSPETVSFSYVPAVAIDDEEDFIGEDLAAALTAAQEPLIFPRARGGTARTNRTVAATRQRPKTSRR
jgi:hypothetical protein